MRKVSELNESALKDNRWVFKGKVVRKIRGGFGKELKPNPNVKIGDVIYGCLIELNNGVSYIYPGSKDFDTYIEYYVVDRDSVELVKSPTKRRE